MMMIDRRLFAVLTVLVFCAACSGSPEGDSTGAGDEAAAPAAAEESGPKVGDKMTTGSGLQYEILALGEGAMPSATDSVTVHYAGTLTDGTEFDSSYKRGKPATFPLNRVIPGWTEGLQLMKEGSKFRFTIPPDLGYGARGVPGTIPPNSTLVFEVELISVN
jgi:FKBP-type peptidyl-prolyl cis-trans isomerase FkpA